MADAVSFTSSTGQRLAGLLDVPAGPVRGWGIFAHGFTLGKDSPAASRICKGLAEEGIGMLRFDNLGLGQSEGDWGDGSFTHKVHDTVLAAGFMAERGTPAALLVGHSFGGAAVLAAAGRVPGLQAVVSVGAPSEPRHVEHNYDALVDRVMADGHAEWLVGGRALTLKRAFVEDVRDADLKQHVRRLTVPLLVMHSPTDSTVSVENASAIFKAAPHPRSFVSWRGPTTCSPRVVRPGARPASSAPGPTSTSRRWRPDRRRPESEPAGDVVDERVEGTAAVDRHHRLRRPVGELVAQARGEERVAGQEVGQGPRWVARPPGDVPLGPRSRNTRRRNSGVGSSQTARPGVPPTRDSTGPGSSRNPSTTTIRSPGRSSRSATTRSKPSPANQWNVSSISAGSRSTHRSSIDIARNRCSSGARAGPSRRAWSAIAASVS